MFEVYKPRGERVPKLPLVTISKNSIVLNKYAREKLKVDRVELAFDTDSNQIRIKASVNGQNIKKTKVFGRGFFNHFGITEKGKFYADYDQDENALFVNMVNKVTDPQT